MSQSQAASTQAEVLHRRVLIVAPPKSGSTHVANVVRRYFGIPEHPFSNEIDWDAEHVLSPVLMSTLRDQDFCFNYHMLARRMNIAYAQREDVGLVGIWRNLGDVVVSLDEHIRFTRENGPMFYIRDHAKYNALPSEERHAWLIDEVVPWYLTFYLGWHVAGLALHPYEEMVRDNRTYFATMLETLLQHPPEAAQLDASLAAPVNEYDRINVGKAGRSKDKLSEANRRRLEEKILLHPDCAQLEVLLWELPWAAPALEPLVPLDGKVVQAQDDDTPYFVSRGRRYPVARTTWLLGRTGERRTPAIVGAAALRPYPVGEPLD